MNTVVVLVYTTREHSLKHNKQDNKGIFVFISMSLGSQSWDIAQYPQIANQSNCAILGGSHVAYTNIK